jgi:hypothetical protein
MLNRLDAIEALVADGRIAQAIRELQNLRERVNGCSSAPGQNDWLVDCPAQLQIREFIDLLITNLLVER